MPLEQPAIMLSVPVGAMVVQVALRSLTPWSLYMLSSQLGNTPRSSARFWDVSWAFSCMKRMTVSAVSSASSEL